MAGKKSGKSAESEQLIAAAEELRKAAELLMGRAAETDSSTSKKSTTKKSSSTKKSSTTKKSTPKSTTSNPKTSAKPKATKPKEEEEPKSDEPEEQTEVEKPKAKPKSSGKKSTKKETAATVEPKAEEPKEEPAPAEEPTEEPTPVEEPKEEPAPVEEPKEEPAPVEEPKEEPKAELPVYCHKCGARNTSEYKFCLQCGASLDGEQEAEPKLEEKPSRRDKKLDVNEIADRTENFIKHKGKLPIFIIVNALFLVCSILLMTVSFHINSWGADGNLVGHGYTVFSYFRNYSEVIGLFGNTATDWALAAYLLIGVLMITAMIMPLALVVKNVIILIVKKDRSVYKIDAVIAFSFLLFYITMINFFGANPPAGPTVSFIIAAVNLAFTIFADLLINRKSGQKLPLFSIVVIALATLAEFLFTSFRIYYQVREGGRDSEYYGASAASAAGGFMFVTYLIAVLALIALIIVQIWKLPSVIDIILPILAAVCALLTLIVARAGMPTGYKFGEGFTIGTVITLLIAVAYLLFTVIPPLRKKCKIQLNTLKPAAVAAADSSAVVTEAQTEPKTEEPAPDEPKAEPAPVEEPKEEEVKEGYCYECDTQNTPGSKFCNNCGAKLKK